MIITHQFVCTEAMVNKRFEQAGDVVWLQEDDATRGEYLTLVDKERDSVIKNLRLKRGCSPLHCRNNVFIPERMCILD